MRSVNDEGVRGFSGEGGDLERGKQLQASDQPRGRQGQRNEDEKSRENEQINSGKGRPRAGGHSQEEGKGENKPHMNQKNDQKKSRSKKNEDPRKQFFRVRALLSKLLNGVENGNFHNMVSIVGSAIQLEFKSSQMLRDILELTVKAIKSESCTVQVKQLLELFQEKGFLGLQTLKLYKSMLPKKKAGKIDVAPMVLADLENWLTVYDQMLALYSCRIDFVAAEDVYVLLMSQEQHLNAMKTPIHSEKVRILSEFQRVSRMAEQVVETREDLVEQLEQTFENYFPKQSQERREGPQRADDDFRSESVIPTVEELLGTVKPVLRPNKKSGEFDDLDHYLGCNFRLMKEDFIVDLRDGIHIFKHSSPKDHNLSVHIYRNATVSGLAATQDFFGFHFTIFNNHGSWMNSRRLKFGTLFVFSSDDFQRNIYQGIVRTVDYKQMDKTQKEFGYAQFFAEVVLENGTDICSVYHKMLEQEVVLIESKAYFESYYHVLTELQNIKFLPFKRQLVKSDPKLVENPSYLQHRAQEEEVISRGYKDASFDESQGFAFRESFDNEIMLIQGPPATGKTYIGEHVVKTLLELKKKFNYPEGPIMLTCFTNHALDQFLGKLLKYTDSVVRLGGRCKNESYQQYQIREIGRKLNIKFTKSYHLQKERHTDLLSQFMRRTESYNSIINVPVFMPLLAESARLNQKAMDNLTLLFSDIQASFKDYIYSFLDGYDWYEAKSIEDFCKTTLRKIFIYPEMFFWLGILTFEIVYELYQQDWINRMAEAAAKENQTQDEEEDELQRTDEYMEEYEEIANSPAQQQRIAQLLAMTLPSDKGFPPDSTYNDLFCKWYEDLPDISLAEMKKEATKILQSIAEKDFLPYERRILLNNYLIELSKRTLETLIEEMVPVIKRSYEDLKELENQTNKQILQQCDVIAMTTTGAAKQQNLLRKIKSNVLVIEEAAQILESHVITSLNRNCKHMILIGDHQQLRPQVNKLELKHKYNLDISMFERLYNNGFSSEMLLVQRRMRPEISEVVKKIYPDMVDHPSIMDKPSIRGIGSADYFFFNHSFPEEELAHIQSKTNQQEADMIIAFADYLLKQLYSPGQITILSLYAGQNMVLKNKLRTNKKYDKEHLIHKVKITTVDNFQGEENDIIILSLVRSNHLNQIGFLKASNRVCVALSRARQGFFIFGNANCLRNGTPANPQTKKSKYAYEAKRQQHIWLEALDHLKQKDRLDSEMVLRCENHSKKTVIKTPSDFDKVPDGGCQLKCKAKLDCGHICQLRCHYQNKEVDPSGHAKIKCNQKCERPQGCGHLCTYKCYQCKDGNKPCLTDLEEELECGHKFQFKCCKKDEPKECKKPCEKKLRCGHQCKRPCFAECRKLEEGEINQGYTSTCKEKIEKKLRCGHIAEVSCGQPMKEYAKRNQCSAPCPAILECGHPCPNKCGQCQDKTFHAQCLQKCGRTNFCNHPCPELCGRGCKPCAEPCAIKCSHSVCPKKCGEECKKCVEPCSLGCEHTACTKKCHEVCDREPCKELCSKPLDCWHPCIGFCGEPCPPYCRVPACKNYNPETFKNSVGKEEDKSARYVLLEDCQHAIEEKALLQLVATGTESAEVKYLACPKCNIWILNCPRIQHVIKRTSRQVTAVKKEVQKALTAIRTKRLNQDDLAALKKSISLLNPMVPEFQDCLPEVLKVAENVVKNMTGLIGSPEKALNVTGQQLAIQGTQINFMTRLLTETREACSYLSERTLKKMLRHMDPFFDQIKIKQISGPRLQALERILKAFVFSLRVLKAKTSGKVVPDEVRKAFRELVDRELRAEDELIGQMEKLLLQHDLVTNQEFSQLVVQVVDIGSGHWYVSPHDQSGGAKEENECPKGIMKIAGGSQKQIDGNSYQVE